MWTHGGALLRALNLPLQAGLCLGGASSRRQATRRCATRWGPSAGAGRPSGCRRTGGRGEAGARRTVWTPRRSARARIEMFSRSRSRRIGSNSSTLVSTPSATSVSGSDRAGRRVAVGRGGASSSHHGGPDEASAHRHRRRRSRTGTPARAIPAAKHGARDRPRPNAHE